MWPAGSGFVGAVAWAQWEPLTKFGFLFLTNAHPQVKVCVCGKASFIWVWGCYGTPGQCCTCPGQCQAQCPAPPLVRCSGLCTALRYRRAASSARVADARHAGEPCGVPGDPGVPGEGMAGTPAAAGRLSPPAKYHSLPGGRRSCRRVPVPFGRGRAGPRWCRSPRPLVRPARPPPAPPHCPPRPPPCGPPRPAPALPPSSGQPCPSPLFSPKANGDEMPRVGPGRARRGRSVHPQSPPLARWPVCGAAGGACQPRPAEWRRSAAGRCCCCCCSRCQVSPPGPRPIVRPAPGPARGFIYPASAGPAGEGAGTGGGSALCSRRDGARGERWEARAVRGPSALWWGVFANDSL